jgi:hypothetical protein
MRSRAGVPPRSSSTKGVPGALWRSSPYTVKVYDVKDSMNHQGMYEPVRPTKQLSIDFRNDFGVLRRVAPDGGRWFVVLPCLTPEALVGVIARQK